MKALYRPISCDFHDLLEALATTKKVVQIRFQDLDGASRVSTSSIVDVFSREGEEYLTTRSGLAVRLDRLFEVDGVQRVASDPCERSACD